MGIVPFCSVQMSRFIGHEGYIPRCQVCLPESENETKSLTCVTLIISENVLLSYLDILPSYRANEMVSPSCKICPAHSDAFPQS